MYCTVKVKKFLIMFLEFLKFSYGSHVLFTMRIQFFHEYEVLNGRGFSVNDRLFLLIFDTKYFHIFFSCSIISSMYLRNDVYFCVFRSVKPLLHDSKCEKLVPKNGRKQWNKLQKIKVRKILNTI